MIKMIFTSLVLVAFVACGKKNDDSPRAPINPQKDTQQVQDSKRAAQEPPKEGDPAKADGSDKTPPAPTAPETKNENTGGSTPAPAPTPAPNITPAPDKAPTPPPATPPVVTGDVGPEKKGDTQTQTPPAPETSSSKPDEAPQGETKPDTKAEEPPKAADNNESQKDQAPEEKKADPAPNAEKQKPENQSQPKAKQAQAEAPFKLGQGYDGSNLNLVANKKNYGEVLLKDEDAKRLYQALRVQENATGGSKEWLPGKKKIGIHVTCYTQESRNQKGVFANRCVLPMNFVKGEFILAPTQLAPDANVKELREAYKGKNLQLIYPDNRRTAWVVIAGMDAKAIYSVMNAPATVSATTKADYQATEIKDSRNIYCVRHIPKANPNNPLYGCHIQLDYATGLAMVVKK